MGGGTKKRDTEALEELFDEYRIAWCIHQLLPYVDRVLGISGTMDFRPIVPATDLQCRLPLVFACLFLARSRRLLLAAHMANVISWAFWMPAVWDHMVWVALMETMFILAAVVSKDEADTINRFLWAVRPALIVLYFSAAFWKLTTSFLDPRTSCANTLVAELAAGLFTPEQMPADSDFAKYLMLSAPAQIIIIEFLVPVVLWLCPRPGIPIAIAFHGAINLMPVTYAGGFSIAMISRLYFFMPGAVYKGVQSAYKDPLSKPLIAAVASIAVLVGLYMKAHVGKIDASGLAFFVFSIVYFKSSYAKYEPPKLKPKKGFSTRLVWLYSFIIAWVYGFGAPIFSFMSMASSTMYGNVIQWGGKPNHLIVPTGYFQDWFRDQGPDWLVDAFGGGIVRVDGYNSTEFYSQLDGADISDDQPEHAKAILQATGSSGKYYEFYASRNYYDREDAHAGTALVRFDDKKPQTSGETSYAFPAYELRRLLTLARNRETSFSVSYVRLPKELQTLTEWRDYVPDRFVKLTVHEGLAECQSLSYAQPADNPLPCDQGEIALLPPPPTWLRSLLHPYPLPLLHGVGDEFVCTT